MLKKRPPLSSNPVAERMRRYRQRRRDKMKCLFIELRLEEVDTLIRRGLLKAEMRNDVDSIQAAIYSHLESSLSD
jgi:hypothetical protein